MKREQVWVFGMYERLTDEEKLDPNKAARVLFFIVEKRDAINLLNLIYEYILPGTTIHSDCWRAYNRINMLVNREYQHLTVNHELYFKDPVTGVHTNSVESIWCSAKIHIKNMRGVSRKYLQSYLDEFCYLHNNNLKSFDSFDAIIKSISKLYPIHRDANISDQILMSNRVNIDDEDVIEIDFDEVDVGDEVFNVVELEEGNIDDFKIFSSANSTMIEGENHINNEILDISEQFDDILELNQALVNVVSDAKLLEMYNEAIEKLLSGEIRFFKFPSSLSNDQRHEIHEKVAELKRTNIRLLISSNSRGGSHRVLYLHTYTNVDDIPKSQSTQKKKTCLAVAAALENVCSLSQPRDKEVESVINQSLVYESVDDQNLEQGVKRSRGRPPKGQEKLKEPEVVRSPINLRNRHRKIIK